MYLPEPRSGEEKSCVAASQGWGCHTADSQVSGEGQVQLVSLSQRGTTIGLVMLFLGECHRLGLEVFLKSWRLEQ